MPFELRIAGTNRGRFETEQQAIEAAKQILIDDPDSDAEVIDLATGRAAAPGSSKRWRDELRSRVGF